MQGCCKKSFLHNTVTLRRCTDIGIGMQPVGHWWGPFRGVDTAKATHDGNATLLGYVQAREQIYVPAYTFVIESPKVHSKLVELAHLASDSKIVLLDYFVNDDVKNVAQPLSHAGLIRKYLLENEEALLNEEVHAA